MAMSADTNSAGDSTIKPTVLVTLYPSAFPQLIPSLQQRFNVLCLDQASDRSSIAQHHSSIVAIVGSRVPSHLIQSLPNLRLVSCQGVGFDKVDLDVCRERGISVSNNPAVSSTDVADLAILLMLTVSRRLLASDRRLRQGSWSPNGEFMHTRKAVGKRVGIVVGLGQIGLAIARRAEAFGCSISYKGRSLKPNVPYIYYSDVLDLATNSDIIFVSNVLNKETWHSIGREVFNALGPDGILVNIARGPIVDEVELIAALQEGRLGAAGLDVFENEPNVPMELCGMDNVVLTPHIGSATVEMRKAMTDRIVANVEAYFSGKPLLTPVL